MKHEFKGTNGKWKVDGFGYVTTLSGNLICDTFSTSIEYDANALLISKAPEMLEMLIKLRGELNAYTPEKIHDELEQLFESATKID